MRTKTLALSAILGALGAASAVAQTNVYSINAVGYINLVLPKGFSIICNQLTTTNNTVAGVFQNNAGNGFQWDGCTVFKYNPGDGHYDQTDIASSSYSSGWVSGGTMTLNPGEAIWFNNGTGHIATNTIVGTVPQGTNTVNIISGFQMIASPVPFSGDVVTNMGFTNYTLGSILYTFNNSSGHYSTYISSSSGTSGYMNQWIGGDPQASIGQGFWFRSNPGPTPWVQIFEINP